MKKSRLLSILFSLVLALTMMQGMTEPAYAKTAFSEYVVNGDDTSPSLQNKIVHFNNVDWFIINENSSGDAAGTVTLLAADTHFGKSQFSVEQIGTYRGSFVFQKLYDLTATGDFKDVADVIKDVRVRGSYVDSEDVWDVKLYLLSRAEADALPAVVKKTMTGAGDDDSWWLRSRDRLGNQATAGFVHCSTGEGDSTWQVTKYYYVRPALQLDLSKVTFDEASKTFNVGKSYPLWIGGTHVTNANKDNVLPEDPNNNKVSYDPASNTLTLNGANITQGYSRGSDTSGIYYSGTAALNIVLADNSVNTVYDKGTGIDTGLYSESGDIIISGTGELSVSGKTAGIRGKKININGKVTASGDQYGISAEDITIDANGIVTASAVGSEYTQYGIWTWNLKVSKGSLTASSTDNSEFGYGINSPYEVKIDGGILNASGSKYGIFANDVIIKNNSTVQASASKTSDSYGIQGNTITIDNSNVNAAADRIAVYGNVKNNQAGTGWSDREDTGKGTSIPVNENGQLISEFEKVKFPEHKHSFTYEAGTGTATNTIIANCSGTDCPLTDNKITLTIVKPALSVYGGSGKKEATLSGLSDFNTATGKKISASMIEYVGRNGTSYDESTSAPTGAGEYTASITVEGKTAKVDYEIAKADNPATVNPTAAVMVNNTVELANNIKLNGALGDVTYSPAGGDTGGCTLAEDGKLTSGNTTGFVTVNVSIAADDNYKALGPTPITVTITEKNAQIITANDVTATYGDTDKSVSATASGGGSISYAVKEGSEDYIDVNHSNGALTIKQAGTATVVVKAAETNSCAPAEKEVTVTINPKAMSVDAYGYTGDYDGEPHGITVNVSDPASGSTVRYGKEDGVYNLDSSPVLTDAGTMTVYYQVTADNYATCTGSATVEVKAKPVQTITAADVTATYGDTGAKVSAKVTNPSTGGGEITYAVKEGSKDYIDVLSSGGNLKIKKAGTAAVIVTAAKTDHYAQTKKEVIVTIKPKTMSVTASGYDGDYDGAAHGITVNVSDPASGATVRYGTEEGVYNLESSPVLGDPGTLTVYYQVTAENYVTYTGKETVKIAAKKAKSVAAAVSANNRNWDGKEEALVTVTGTASGGTMRYAIGRDAQHAPSEGWGTAIPTGTNTGTYYVWYKAIGDLYHSDSDPACVIVTIAEKSAPIPAPVPAAASVTVNSKTVGAETLYAAMANAGVSADSVTTITLGKKVKKIKKGTFSDFRNADTLVVHSKKLTKARVKGSLKGSTIRAVKVEVGKKKVNKRYVRKYKKIFTKKNAGKKVTVHQ